MNADPTFQAGQQWGEVIGKLEALESAVGGLKQSVEKMESSIWRRIDVDGKDIRELKVQVGELTGAKTWIVRSVIGGLIGLGFTSIGSAFWFMAKR